jgi:Rrf2 family protein
MRLTKSTSHAIRILIDCARAGGRLVKVAEVSARLNITPQNVFKIVNLLARAGLLEACRGRNGGVRLARPAADIRIGDVVRTTEATRVQIDVLPERRDAGGGVNRILDDALGAFIDVLDRHTLADMAKAHGPTKARRKHSPQKRSVNVAILRTRRAVYQRQRGRAARRPLE